MDKIFLKNKKILITGGEGFIGSAVVRFIINQTNHEILSLDKLTYASTKNKELFLNGISNPRYKFIKGDICNEKIVKKIFFDFNPNIVMHLAAETHVDRSIDDPTNFIQTNIVGTSVLLKYALQYWSTLSNKSDFIFHHISTDEVYGELGNTGVFTEISAYNPSSPYSASKASSDHLVRAWSRTYGLPVIITNSSNNFGPYQFPEKLIPLIILNALEGRPLPIYGDGQNIRDWLYVEDHASALYKVITDGEIGETYNIGSNNEKTNLEVVNALCEILDELKPNNLSSSTSISVIKSYKDLIKFVKDRPGHDKRYAVDSNKIKQKLRWVPLESFETGLRKTVKWYLNNLEWCQKVQYSNYQRQRLGLKKFKKIEEKL